MQPCWHLQGVSRRWLLPGGPLPPHVAARPVAPLARAGPPRPQDLPSIPHDQDFDNLVLDEAYYNELGMTMSDVKREQRDLMYDADPEAMPADEELVRLLQQEGRLPPDWQEEINKLEAYGPPALVMAGFQIEEYAMTRAVLDEAGAPDIKLLPVTQDMLSGTVGQAIHEDEIDWAQPRPDDWVHGGAVGAQRTILFSGLDLAAQATILELLEALGLPPMCVTMALEAQAGMRLGEALAQAVKSQRKQQQPKQQLWEQSGRAVVEDQDQLAPLSDLISEDIARRRANVMGQEGVGRVSEEEVEALSAWFQQEGAPVWKIDMAEEEGQQQGGPGASTSSSPAGPAAAAPGVPQPAAGTTTSSSSAGGQQGSRRAQRPLFSQPGKQAFQPETPGAEGDQLPSFKYLDLGPTPPDSATPASNAAGTTTSSSSSAAQDSCPASASQPAAEDFGGLVDDWGMPIGVDLDAVLGGLEPSAAAGQVNSTSRSARGAAAAYSSPGPSSAINPATPSSTTSSSSSKTPASPSRSSSSTPGAARQPTGSMLARVRAALERGADPEQLQQMLMQAGGQAAPQAPAAAGADAEGGGQAAPPASGRGGAGGASAATTPQQQKQQAKPKGSLAAKLLQKRAAGAQASSMASAKDALLRGSAKTPPSSSAAGKAASSGSGWRAPSSSSVARLERTSDGKWVEAPVSPLPVTPPSQQDDSEEGAQGWKGTAAAGGAAASAAGPGPEAQSAAAGPLPYGPEPPPPETAAEDEGSGSSSAQMRGLLQLRPDIQRAFAENRVKFVNLAKLPGKYREQYVNAAASQREQQQRNMQRVLEELQQQKDGARERARQLMRDEAAGPSPEKLARDAEVLRAQQAALRAMQKGPLPPSAAAGAGAVGGSVPSGSGSPAPQQQDSVPSGGSTAVGPAPFVPHGSSSTGVPSAGEVLQAAMAAAQQQQGSSRDGAADAVFGNFDGVGDEEAMQGPVLSVEQVLQMQEAAAAQGLSFERALAEAIVCGVRVPAEVAAAAGVELPSTEILEQAKQQVLEMLNEVDWEKIDLGGGEEGEEDTSSTLSSDTWQEQEQQQQQPTVRFVGPGAEAMRRQQQLQQEQEPQQQQQQQPPKQVAQSRSWGASLKGAAGKRRLGKGSR